jgi:hypothetical protein
MTRDALIPQLRQLLNLAESSEATDDQLNAELAAFARALGAEAQDDSRYVAGKGQEARHRSLAYLSDALGNAQRLTICDPYFYMPSRAKGGRPLDAELGEVLPEALTALELFVKPDARDEATVATVAALCEGRGIALDIRLTHDIHDRVWIRDGEEGYIVGTSFNGLGNKCAFILPLPEEDLAVFQEELTRIRAERH